MGKGNILLVADHFYPFRGGLEAFCLHIATRLVSRGYVVSVLTYQYDEALPLQQTHEGIEIYRVPSREILKDTYSLPKFFSQHTKKTLAHLSSQKWEAVITNTRFFSSCFLGRRVARKSKSPFVHIEHGNSFVKHLNPFVVLGAYLYDQIFGRFIISTADKVVTISQRGAQFVKKLGAKHSSVVYNSVDTQNYVRISEAEQKKIRDKHDIALDDFVVIYIGRLIFAKGVQHLINVIDKIPNGKLIIIGDGPYRADLKLLAKTKKVEFLGSQPSEVCRSFISVASCLCNPSYNEGIPTSILEAGSVGVPVVATNVGGTKEIIPDIRYGVVIEPKDEKALLEALETIKKNKSMTKSMISQLRHRVQNIFDWEVNLEKLCEIISSVSVEKKK